MNALQISNCQFTNNDRYWSFMIPNLQNNSFNPFLGAPVSLHCDPPTPVPDPYSWILIHLPL